METAQQQKTSRQKYEKRWRDNNRESCRQKSRKYYLAHKEKLSEKRRARYRLCKPVPNREAAYRFAAKRRSLDFSLSTSQFNSLLALPCHYCGQDEAKGIDRLNNEVGYYSYNVVPCCFPCNRMKMDSDLRSFLSKIKQIAVHLSL